MATSPKRKPAATRAALGGSKAAPESDPKPPPKARTPRKGTLHRELEEFFAGIALLVYSTGDEHCGQILVDRGPALAEAYANLADESPAVKRILTGMLQGSAWGAAIMVTASTVIPIAAHHDLLPSGMPLPFSFGSGGGVPPSPEVAGHDPFVPPPPDMPEGGMHTSPINRAAPHPPSDDGSPPAS